MCAFICVALFVWVGITFLPLYSLASVLCTCISMYYTTHMHKHTMHKHVHVHTAIHVTQASTQILYMYVLTHTRTRTCAYAYRQDIHTTRSCSVFHTYTALPSMCTVFFFISIMAPWDYALRMAYDNEAFAHHARHYHGWRSNSSLFLDLPVRMMKQALPVAAKHDDSIRPAICVIRAWHKTPTLLVTPAQLKRPGIGRNASCALGDCSTSRS